MERQRPLSETATTPADTALEQSCNECRRRKGRCDKQIPECGPCARNKRHCLYERHSKTPLTRKHLTAVEERLRQAEMRLKQMEHRATAAEAKLQTLMVLANHGDNAAKQTHTGGGEKYLSQLLDSAKDATFYRDQISHDAAHSTSDFEAAPSHAELSWDETAIRSPLSSTQADFPQELVVIDGMASLSVEDSQTGYLGIASGAAMLKLMLPDTKTRQHSKARTSISHNDSTGEGYSWIETPLYWERQIGTINLDAAIDAYFACYHLSYPIIHEPTFRAEYARVILRPDGKSWNALAYIVGAIGMFSTASGPSSQDLDLFEAAKSNISIDSLETGNITLVQALTLMSNYLQKSGKPNSGYNYLGLALHMAMGLGLHKEWTNWRITPLSMEIRRRTWWTLYVFASGASYTLGRPIAWPSHGIEVTLPLNVDDHDLTHVSAHLPSPKLGITPYSAVASQARLHLATNDIYTRIISNRFPSASELLQLDDERIEPWLRLWTVETGDNPHKYYLSRKILEWRYRNFRIIMYRFHLIRHILRERSTTSPHVAMDSATQEVIDRCLFEAKASIESIYTYWNTEAHICMAGWYALYFMFAASLIPTMMLRNDPMSAQATNWRNQIHQVLAVLESMHATNTSSKECHQFIVRLCGGYLGNDNLNAGTPLEPVEESPETQLTDVYNMMWAGMDMDTFMPDDSWMAFLNNMASESPPEPPFGILETGGINS